MPPGRVYYHRPLWPAVPDQGTSSMIKQSLRLLACALLATLAALLAPTAASASTTQLSLLQDDREFLGQTGEDLDAAANELENLGVDILRTNVNFNKVYRTPRDRKKPSDFVTDDPTNSHYDWGAIDRLVSLAKANNVRVLMTITGPGPFFSSESPSRCRKLPCTYKPKTSEFERFAAAVAKRYRGQADYYAIWNEPNIGKTWLTPRYAKRRGVGTIDLGMSALYPKVLRGARLRRRVALVRGRAGATR